MKIFHQFLLWLAIASSAKVADAQLLYRVTINTDSLRTSGETFGLFFQMVNLDRATNGPGQNRVSVRRIDFHGGLPGSADPMLTGGASGDLRGSPREISIRDQEFLNEFSQTFHPGSSLTFEVYVTTSRGFSTSNYVNLGPDSLSFDIFSTSGDPIPTVGLLDEMLSLALDPARPEIESFRSDLSRTSLNVPAPVVESVFFPALTIALNGSSVVIRWPPGTAGWALEGSGSLASIWTELLQLNGTQSDFTTSSLIPYRFFRLRRL